ncbi:hypothetical protein [Caldithrix abyssi]
MKKWSLIIIGLLMFIQFSFGGKVTWLQYFYAIKQIFPDEKQVSILIPKQVMEAEQKDIRRAAAITKFTVKLFPVEDTRDIGTKVKMVKKKSILIIYDDTMFRNKSSMLYILSRANERELMVVTNSEEYGEKGAFLTLCKKDDKKLKIVVNLKFKPELAAKFTPEFQQKLGITQVLQ